MVVREPSCRVMNVRGVAAEQVDVMKQRLKTLLLSSVA